MLEIIATIGLSAVFMYAILQAVAWLLHGRRAGRQERALFLRWAMYHGLLMVAISGWVLAGIAAFLSGAAFWRGAYVGGSVVLWLGYVPTLVWVVCTARRQQAAARAADSGSIG